MIQDQLIERVRRACVADPRIVAALMYGSFAKGEADEFSDIEFYLFVADDQLAAFDQAAWLAQIAAIELILTNEFGTRVVIFGDLIRGEFHFQPAARMALVEEWGAGGESPRPAQMITLDRTGALATHLDRWRRTVVRPTAPERVQQIADQLLNNMLFGANVLRRGERARALEILGMIHRGLLWMARAATQQTQHWPTPSKALERELPPELYQRFIGCTAGLMDDALEQAYQESWRWGVELIDALVTSSGIARRAQLIAALDRTIAVSR